MCVCVCMCEIGVAGRQVLGMVLLVWDQRGGGRGQGPRENHTDPISGLCGSSLGPLPAPPVPHAAGPRGDWGVLEADGFGLNPSSAICGHVILSESLHLSEPRCPYL